MVVKNWVINHYEKFNRKLSKRILVDKMRLFACPRVLGRVFALRAPYAIECMQYGLTAVEKQTAPKTICLVVALLVSLMKDQNIFIEK